VVFEAFRKPADVEPAVRVEMPAEDPLLRNEIDPDPLIEEMVARLRSGLTTLHAVDEWGRPLAWRNVVRLALGPLAGRLRDTEQALELAVSMIPVPEEPTDRRVADRRADDAEPDEAVAAAVEAEPVAEAAPVEEPQATVDVILPAAEAVTNEPVEHLEVAGHAILVEDPIEVDDEAVAAIEAEHGTDEIPTQAVITVVPAGPTGATSLFTVSGDQRAVAVSPLSPSELVSGSSPDDTTTAKYDRFLTGLYGERKQMSADEDRRSRGTGLGDNL
jgi:hypothetical protein